MVGFVRPHGLTYGFRTPFVVAPGPVVVTYHPLRPPVIPPFPAVPPTTKTVTTTKVSVEDAPADVEEKEVVDEKDTTTVTKTTVSTPDVKVAAFPRPVYTVFTVPVHAPFFTHPAFGRPLHFGLGFGHLGYRFGYGLAPYGINYRYGLNYARVFKGKCEFAEVSFHLEANDTPPR